MSLNKAVHFGITTISILILFVLQPVCISAHAQSDLPIVRAVLFYSPTCGHCEMVIRETLPPLTEHYGEQLHIIGVDTTQPQGQVLFEAVRNAFDLELVGVPFLVVGDEYLIGSVEIPEQFPGLIEKYLAQEGVDWPDIPELRDAIHAAETAQAPTPTAIPPTTSASLPAPTLVPVMPRSDAPPDNLLTTHQQAQMTVWQRVQQDPTGNWIAIAVLVMMIIVLVGGLFSLNNIPAEDKYPQWHSIIPVLCLLGLAVAGYLAYVETTQTSAVCGPVGDCNTVQQSEYARLFGILPIGILGIIGYLAILMSWGMTRIGNQNSANLARLTMSALSTFGILFSIYLTFLEPFVIGATCA